MHIRKTTHNHRNLRRPDPPGQHFHFAVINLHNCIIYSAEGAIGVIPRINVIINLRKKSRRRDLLHTKRFWQ